MHWLISGQQLNDKYQTMNDIRDLINKVHSQGGPDRASMIKKLAALGYETNYLELATNEELRQMLSNATKPTSESTVKPSDLTGRDAPEEPLSVNTFINLTPHYQNYEHLVGRVLNLRSNGRVDILIVAADLKPGKKGPVSRGSKITLNRHYLKNAQTFLPEGPAEVIRLAQFAAGGGIPGGQSPADILGEQDVVENLRDWFKEKWVRFGPDGKIRGACARGDDSEGKPKCLPQAKAHALGKKGRASAAARKRREDPNPERHGSAINVATKKKTSQAAAEGTLKELAPSPGFGGGNYFQELASAWYNGLYDTGNIENSIKSQEDVERLLERGIVCPDGVTRKFHIDYNANYDGVVIFSDDYYRYGSDDETIDSRTGKKWGPYDFMEFSGDELDESVDPGIAEGSNKNQEAIRRIQKMLNDKFGANLDIDGILGPLTLKSINKFMPNAKKHFDKQDVAEDLNQPYMFYRGEPILSPDRLKQLKASVGKPYPILRKAGSAANIGTYMSPDGEKATSFVQQALAGQGKGGSVTKIAVDPSSFQQGDGGIDEAVIITNIAGLVSSKDPDPNDPLRINDRKQAMLHYLGPGVRKYMNDPLLNNPKLVQQWYDPEFAKLNWNTIKSGKQAVTKPGQSKIQEKMIQMLGPMAEKIRRDPEVIKYFLTHNPGDWVEYNFRMNSDGSGTKVVDVTYYPPAKKQGVAEDQLTEFVPFGSSGDGAARWYTDDQMIDIVGPDWAPEDDVSHLSLSQRLEDAQAWLDDQGYSVIVEKVEIDPEGGYRWKIYGEFYNPRFAQKDNGVAEGEVIKGRFGQKFVPTLGRTVKTSKYEHNPDIEVPVYDPVKKRVWHAGVSDPRDQQPFDHFETSQSKIGVTTHIIGITKDGQRVQVSTTSSPDLAQALVDAYNRGGFTDLPIERVPFPLDEKQDACYRKVKSRYKVWPSAYASGALVQCRKKGAANWGNKVKESSTKTGDLQVEHRFDEPLSGWHIVYRKSGNPVLNTPSFETKEQAQKYLMTKMFKNHQDFHVAHTAGVREDVTKAAPTTTAYILRGADAEPGRLQQIAQAYGYDPVEIQGNEIKWKPSTGAPVTVGNVQGNQATLNYRMTDQGSQLPGILKKLGATAPAPAKAPATTASKVPATAPAMESLGPENKHTYILYIRDQAVSEYESIRDAQRELVHLLTKFPSQKANFSIKKKTCRVDDIKDQSMLESAPDPNACPHCAGSVYSNRYLAEKMNACYRKGKSLFSFSKINESVECRKKTLR
jgi:hypothetical protein